MVQSPVDISSPSVCSSSEERTSTQVLPPVSSETRPSFLRSPSNRRWTLAVSETPENELVEELERLRRIGWALGFQGELVKVKGEEEVKNGDLDMEVVTETNGNVTGRRQESNPSSSSIPSNVKWRKEEMEQWLIARKALLVCREIVRTEKTYREGLETLQRGGVGISLQRKHHDNKFLMVSIRHLILLHHCYCNTCQPSYQLLARLVQDWLKIHQRGVSVLRSWVAKKFSKLRL